MYTLISIRTDSGSLVPKYKHHTIIPPSKKDILAKAKQALKWTDNKPTYIVVPTATHSFTYQISPEDE